MDNPQLRQAIETAQLGFYDQARITLLQVIREDADNELAWLWLAQVLDDPRRQRDCLRQVLRINPDSADALRGIEALQAGRPLPEPGTGAEVTSEPEVAFGPVEAPETEPASDEGFYDLLDDSYYAEASNVEVSAGEPPFAVSAVEPESDTLPEAPAIFEVQEPEPPVTHLPEPEPESFLERARRVREHAAMPSPSQVFVSETGEALPPGAASPPVGEEAGEPSKRGSPFSRRRQAQSEAADTLLAGTETRSRRFRFFDHRVLLGILGLVEFPLIALLLFLLFRSGDLPLIGAPARRQLQPSSAACRALDLDTFIRVETLGGELTVDTVYTGTRVLVTETIVVPAGRRLLLYPGATLVFTRGATIEAYGALYACGSEALPVALTAAEETPGGWEGVRLYNPTAESVLSHVAITHAGERALYLRNSAVTLSDVRIADSARFPISLDGSVVPDLSRNVDLSENPFKGVEIRPGALPVASAVWPNYAVPYVITGLLRVDEGTALDIQPGAVVKFWREPMGQLPGIWVRGLLKAESVHFTSVHDTGEDVGGVTYLEAVDPQPGDWGSLTFFNSSAKSYLRDVVIRYGGRSNSAVVMRGSAPELTRVTVTDAASYPLSADTISEPVLNDVKLADNTPGNALEILGELPISERAEITWGPLGGEMPVARVIRDVVTVGTEAKLTLLPGVVLKFVEDGQLVVRGTLVAIGGGSPDGRIVFTSVHDDEYGGDVDGNTSPGDRRSWGGLVFDGVDASSELRNVIVRYAPVTLLHASPMLSNSQFADAPGAPLRLSPDSVPQLTSNRYVDNGLYGIAVLTGTLETDQRWARIDSPAGQVVRILEGEVTVGPRAALEIEAGTVIKAGPAGKLTVLGDLRTAGLGTQAVVFTSLNDDEAGGDTNVRALAPAAGDWLGIEVAPEANVHLADTAIYYARYGLTVWGDMLPVVDKGRVHIAYGVQALRCEAKMQIPQAYLIEQNEINTTRCPSP